MTKGISDAQLLQFGDAVARHFGLNFPKERWPDLQRGLRGAAEECGCQQDLDRYVDGLLAPTLSEMQLKALANRLTVGETYFLREKRSLEVLEKDIVPELMRTRRDRAIRIWSAGCATGEEPYSIAILLSKLMSGLKKWNVEILATDLNAKSLQKASEGIYGEWSFRGTPPWIRQTYFQADGNGHSIIAPALKKMVSFSQHNLMNDTFPPLSNSTTGFDVILCRNVLMYFTPEAMRKVIHRFHGALATDGWLIVSPTETSQELFSEFATVSFGDVTFYRKSATCVSTSSGLSAFDEGRSSVQLPKLVVEVLKPTRTSFLRTGTENSPSDVPPPNAAPPAVSYGQDLYGQALAFYEQGRYEEVERVIRILLSQDGSHAAMLLLARAYANQGKLAAALVLCDEAIAADKMAARAYYLRATILQEQGSLPAALLAFQQTVYAEPEFMLGHFALGSLALKQGKLKESEKHFANVLLLLARYEPEDILPESEGLSAGRLREMIVLTTSPGSTSQRTAAACTGKSHIGVPQRVGNLKRSRQ
jgi:chemotaxis protein methyltransferase CheR